MITETKPTLTAESWAGSWGRRVDSQQRRSVEMESRSPRTRAVLPMGSRVVAVINQVSLMEKKFLDSRKETEPLGWKENT